MGKLRQNLRYAARVLSKNPGFTSIAILSLALGIGANTAVFTLVNALLLRELPVREPERLVEVSATRASGNVPFSYPMFRELERGQRVFSGLIGWSPGTMANVESNGVLSRNRVVSVSGNYYSELGVVPLLGRLLNEDDANPRAGATNQVAVLGYEFWQRAFGGAQDAVGKQIRIEGHSFSVVGVTRKWFAGMTVGAPPEITIPITAYPGLMEGNEFSIDNRSLLWVFVTGRLKNGIGISQARAQLLSFWPQVLRAAASTDAAGLRRQTFLSMGLAVSPVPTGLALDLRSQFSRPLYVLWSIVGLILLAACVNLANLMLARAAARSQEMSVRLAIGASRGFVVRQVLAESLTLSLAGALLGLALAYWGSRLLMLLMTQGNSEPVSLNLSPDLRVLSLTALIAVLTGMLFGIAPAWRSSREDPASALRQNSPSLSAGTGKLSRILIVSQVTLSLVLLFGAGLLVRSFQQLSSVDPGIQKESVIEVSLYPRPGGYRNLDMPSYIKQLIGHLYGVAGISSVSYARAPVTGHAEDGWREDVSPNSADSSAVAAVKSNGAMVSPGYFATLGIPILRGRDFDETDDSRRAPCAILNASLAERLFPNGDALGKQVHFGFMPDFQKFEVVGIVGNARVFDYRNPTAPAIYFSIFQYPAQWGYLLVRTKKAPERMASSVDQAIASLGREYPVWTKTISQILSEEIVEERVTAMLSGSFAVLALLLASVGLYGLMSYTVTRRTREIGIRVALGAQRGNVVWMVLRETLRVTLLGVGIGIPCALAVSRLIASMLYSISPGDPATVIGVSLILLVVALIAGYLPARRASDIDPMAALRAE